MTRPTTPFYPRAAQASHTPWWYGWNGYLVPDIYTDPFTELRAIRTAAALIDMSPLPRYEVTGPDAAQFVDHLVTRDAQALLPGQLFYTPLCDYAGKLVADGLVIRLSKKAYRLTMDHCHKWFAAHAGGFDIRVEDLTERYGLLALQGPHASAVLAAAAGNTWKELAFSRYRSTRIGSVPIDLARTGFTGERGYELWVRAEDAPNLWDALSRAGETFGLRPAGEFAVDMARVEAGLIVITADYTGSGPDDHSAEVPVGVEIPASPFELGLGRFVDLNKPDFIGREALIADDARNPDNLLTGLELDWAGVAALYRVEGRPPAIAPRVRWDALAVHANERRIGWATSITWSPTLQKLIGFGRVESKFARPGARLTVEWPAGEKTGPVNATVVPLPFIQRNWS